MKNYIKIYFILTAMYIALALLGGLLLFLFTPDKYFEVFPSVGIFFWACGMVMTYVLGRLRDNKGKLLNAYMICRIAKFFLTMVFLLIGIKALGFERIPFAISMVGNYIVFSAAEAFIYYYFNKRTNSAK